MQEPTHFSAPARRSFRRRAAALSLVIAGFAGGVVVASGVDPAAGDPPPTDWTTLTLESDWANASAYVPNYDLQYKVDSDGDVHVRGAVVTDGVTVHRYPSDEGGPWTAKIAQLPCGLYPEFNSGGDGMINDLEGRSGYSGSIQVGSDGAVNVVVWDAPVFEIDGDVKMAVVVSGNFSYDPDADDSGCEPAETTTTAPEETTTTAGE